MTKNVTSLFIEVIGDSLRNRVLEFFVEGRRLDYPIKYVAEDLRIHRNTIYEIFSKLLKEEMLIMSRKIGSSTFYKLNLSNKSVMLLVELFDGVIREEINKIHNETLHEMIPEELIEARQLAITIPRSEFGNIYTEIPKILGKSSFSMYHIC